MSSLSSSSFRYLATSSKEGIYGKYEEAEDTLKTFDTHQYHILAFAYNSG
eukprot:CAMPEP_0194146044 /NCGR_PEP_ID=MMETSP0152-20130528/19364_1 /TAXON_ID=1049557 /ORGANISM="Thalassiothrix antarctica, Strain L6-D1" /LENGTH=49 /DNA_ID=CAMNT_0038846449 /DNA_START=127 /DNA_END=276 /DNA_ORIENTATION=+